MVLIANFARVLRQSQKVLQTTKHLQDFRQFSVSALLKSERRYTEKHEWVSVEGSSAASVGISTYAQEALGDIVYAQLPDPGTVFKQGDECGALESVKAASEVYCPVSGEVTEKNAEVEDTPGLINSQTYTKGWLFKIKLSDATELDKLMTEEQYTKYLKEADH